MPATKHRETAEHPAEGFRSIATPGCPNRPLCVYLPTDYQPKYAYPLVVLFHDDGESEDHAARLVPLLSRRNYVALCLRGTTKLGLRSDGRPAFGWGDEPDRGAKAALASTAAQFNIHPERVFLVGVGEGASAAYRFARALRKCSLRLAGLVALNGTLPERRLTATALRVLVAHGATNPVAPFSAARRCAASLRAAGAEVRVNRYPTSHRLHPDMLRDANRWIMAQVAEAKG